MTQYKFKNPTGENEKIEVYELVEKRGENGLFRCLSYPSLKIKPTYTFPLRNMEEIDATAAAEALERARYALIKAAAAALVTTQAAEKAQAEAERCAQVVAYRTQRLADKEGPDSGDSPYFSAVRKADMSLLRWQMAYKHGREAFALIHAALEIVKQA